MEKRGFFKMKKSVKVFLMIAIVAIVSIASVAIYGMKNGSGKSKASNYYGTLSGIYFDNTEVRWNAVYAYCWDKKGNVDVYELKQCGANAFCASINGYLYDGMLFKNTPGKDNWDKQSKDLKMPYGPSSYMFSPTTYEGAIDGKVYDYANSSVTVYYKNDTITNPHIYYQVGNGKWTDGFGYKMIESKKKPGYYEAEIFLPANGSVKCCFNNGDNNTAWDNNNTKDYSFTFGVPAWSREVTIDNGVMTTK